MYIYRERRKCENDIYLSHICIYIYVCMYVYIYMVTPPPSTDPGSIFPVCSGRGRGEKHHSKIPRVSKNPKNPTQGSAFWKLEREPQNPKTEQIPRVSKIPKKPTPRFGFLETRAGASKSKNRANSSSFQNSKKNHPKVWIFGNSSGSLKIQKSSKFLEFPKFQKSKKIHPKVWIFGNSSGSLKIQKSSKFLEFPKSPTLGWIFLDFWNFGNSRNLLDFWILRKFLEFPKFQKNPPQGLDFWKLEREPQNPKIEQIPRVSKIPNLGVGFWIFGILETRGICSIFGF